METGHMSWHASQGEMGIDTVFYWNIITTLTLEVTVNISPLHLHAINNWSVIDVLLASIVPSRSCKFDFVLLATVALVQSTCACDTGD